MISVHALWVLVIGLLFREAQKDNRICTASCYFVIWCLWTIILIIDIIKWIKG